MSRTDAVIESLEEIKEEDVSNHVRERIDEMIGTLREDIDMELRVDKVRSILEELDEDGAVPNYVRTQLWNVSAALELL